MTEALIEAVASLGVPLLFVVVAALAFAETALFVGGPGHVVGGAAFVPQQGGVSRRKQDGFPPRTKEESRR